MKTIKKSIALLLALVMVLAIAPISAFAEDDALNYLKYIIENDEVIIIGYKNDPVDLVIPAEIEGKPVTFIGIYAFEVCRSLKSITIPDSVTSIGGGAFHSCSSLQSITIPDSVESIGYAAFSGCSSLQSITIPDSVTSIGNSAFKDCSSLESITIPDSVTSIEWDAFSGCSSLQSITIPDSVTSIEWDVFSGCSSLQSITIPDSVTSIGDCAFRNCSSLQSITIPDSVTSIHYDAFSGCSSLSSVTVAEGNPVYDSRNNCNAIIETATDTLILGCANTLIPESVIGIYSAFNGIENIKSITIPNGVEYIIYSFSNCNQLKEISFPDSLKVAMIDFSGCINLEKISIGDIAFENQIIGVETTKYYQNEANWEDDMLYIGNHIVAIRENATGEYIIREGTKTISQFGDYRKMKSVIVPDSIVTMPMLHGTPVYNNPDNWENGALYIGNHLIATDETIAKDYTIKEGTKSISVACFSNNSTIESVIIPDTVTFIPYACFDRCNSLKRVSIPNTIEYIGFSAFLYCNALETIEIPETAEYIGIVVFYGCESLTDVYIYNGDCYLLNYGEDLPFDSNITIHSYAGGKVEEFANRYGYNFVALPPKPHTHTFGEWTIVTPATYTAAGEKTRACTGCEETEIEVIPMLVAENVATNDNTGITVKYDDSVYGEDIQLDISEVTEGAAFELVNGDNGNGHHKSKLFDINTTVNGVKVQPNGKVLVGIPVPRGFNEKKVVIYYVTDDGSRLEKLDSYVENGIIWFETDHFSYYAVVDESEIVEEKSAWELFLDILRNFFRLILKLFSFSL